MDARHARAPSAFSPAQVDPGEALAAATAVSMLVRALQRLGLEAGARGYVVSARLPGGNGQTTARVVVLGHHPHHGGRLWWWLPALGFVRPDGASGSEAALQAIGPVDEAAAAADQIARLLYADAAREHDGAVRPHPKNPMNGEGQ